MMKVITIGSNPQCDIIVERDYMLPIHCQIVQNEQDFRLICFGKWIQVNGKKVSFGEKLIECILHINDVVSIDLEVINWLHHFFECPSPKDKRFSYCIECYGYEVGEPHFCGEYGIYHYGQLFENRKI